MVVWNQNFSTSDICPYIVLLQIIRNQHISHIFLPHPLLGNLLSLKISSTFFPPSIPVGYLMPADLKLAFLNHATKHPTHCEQGASVCACGFHCSSSLLLLWIQLPKRHHCAMVSDGALITRKHAEEAHGGNPLQCVL